jgi:hypothetical protein
VTNPVALRASLRLYSRVSGRPETTQGSLAISRSRRRGNRAREPKPYAAGSKAASVDARAQRSRPVARGKPARSHRPPGPRGRPRAAEESGPPTWTSSKGVLVAALGLFGLTGLLLFDPGLFTGGDNVVYLLLAKALAGAEGYVTLYEPGNPPHTFYPPGYPLLLTPLFWIFEGLTGSGLGEGGGWERALLAGKVLSFVAAIAVLLLTARYLRERLEPTTGGLAVYASALLVTATNTTFLSYSHWTLSEMPYFALSLGALILAEREGGGARIWLTAVLLTCGGYLIRTAGLPLCLAVIWAIWRRHGRRPGLLAAAVVIFVVVGWSLRNALVDPSAPGYLDQLLAVDPYAPAEGTLTVGSFLERVATNAGVYAFIEIPRIVWPEIPSFGRIEPAGLFLGTLLVPLVVYGFVRQVRRARLAAGEAYVLLYFALLAIWPWNGERFVLPILPLLVSYGGLAMADFAGLLRGRIRPAQQGGALALSRPSVAAIRVAILASALVAVPNLWGAVRNIPEQLAITGRHLRGERLAGYSPTVRDYFSAARWIGETSPPDAVIVSRKPQFTYLFSDRKSLIYPYSPPEEIEREVREGGADYLIFDRLGSSALIYLRPYLMGYLDRYDIVREIGDPPTVVLRRRSP